ncbi:MAG TPA: helix-turn-helix transcriptional regulator, partial [Ilumatobacteraceae bacterium]|nr:helix-turn-helix transcriptional regulator [Ilumatobacteraceae bacterium]
ALAEGRTLSWDDAIAFARRSRGERKRPVLGWDALTPTEREVVEAIADGLTNPQVAARLLMGRETVKSHVSSVYTKLAVTNRVQLVALVVARPPVTGPQRLEG